MGDSPVRSRIACLPVNLWNLSTMEKRKKRTGTAIGWPGGFGKLCAATAGSIGSPLRSKFGVLMRLDHIVEPERVDIGAGSCVKAATTNLVANFGHGIGVVRNSRMFLIDRDVFRNYFAMSKTNAVSRLRRREQNLRHAQLYCGLEHIVGRNRVDPKTLRIGTQLYPGNGSKWITASNLGTPSAESNSSSQVMPDIAEKT